MLNSLDFNHQKTNLGAQFMKAYMPLHIWWYIHESPPPVSIMVGWRKSVIIHILISYKRLGITNKMTICDYPIINVINGLPLKLVKL